MGQLTPIAVEQVGGNWFRASTDWKYNLDLSAKYYKWCLAQGKSTKNALIAYNAGLGVLQRYLRGGSLPSETRNYVRIIHG